MKHYPFLVHDPMAAFMAASAADCACSDFARRAALLAMSARRMGSGCENTRQSLTTAVAVLMLHIWPTLECDSHGLKKREFILGLKIGLP